jgi:hypothetical protein
VNLRLIEDQPIPHMNPATLLQKFGISDLTPEEEAELTRELSAAYHADEAAATSRDVQRIAEKVRARLQQVEAEAPSVEES